VLGRHFWIHKVTQRFRDCKRRKGTAIEMTGFAESQHSMSEYVFSSSRRSWLSFISVLIQCGVMEMQKRRLL
jgi:hypothetical protein